MNSNVLKFMTPPVQVFCCNRIPKSTETEYYLDPKIMTGGHPNFEPGKIKHKISGLEFSEMRQKMINAGDEPLKTAKLLFIIMRIYAILCIIAGIGILIFGLCFPEKVENWRIPLVINIGVLVIPSTFFQCYWKYSMQRACEKIEKVFEEQNEKVYSKKGVLWSIDKTLMYMRIKMIEGMDFQEYYSGGDSKMNLSLHSQSEKNMILEMMNHKVSNREILLK